jgi:hypothetical protein
MSFDDGQTWTYRYSFYAEVFAFCANGNVIAGKSGGGCVLSADSGASWKQVSILGPSALLPLPSGGVLVGTDTTGIYMFSDNGDSIKTLNEGLTDLHVHTFALGNAGYVYVGTNKGILRRPLSQLVPVREPPKFPKAFRLEQNYPNPFNPNTTIKYELPKSSVVRLSVFDILGREVSVLVKERKDAGVHEVKFDGSNLASGVYFCRIQAGNFAATKRLLLLK